MIVPSTDGVRIAVHELGGTGRLHGAVFLTPDGATVEKAQSPRVPVA